MAETGKSAGRKRTALTLERALRRIRSYLKGQKSDHSDQRRLNWHSPGCSTACLAAVPAPVAVESTTSVDLERVYQSRPAPVMTMSATDER